MLLVEMITRLIIPQLQRYNYVNPSSITHVVNCHEQKKAPGPA
jgi:hypothetical protein